MVATVQQGGTMFEIAYGVCFIPWEQVAEIARKTGIKEISLCHFWGKDKATGRSLSGDPLGSKRQRLRAYRTMEQIFIAAETLRNRGVTVRFIDGPLGWLLGHDYSISAEEQMKRLVRFFKHAGRRAKVAGLTLAIEFLRPCEDKVIGGTERLLELIRKVKHPNVKGHLDAFHAGEQKEDPVEAARKGRNEWVYVHGHAGKRKAPGSPGDEIDWTAFLQEVAQFTTAVGTEGVPFIFEPFSAQACREEPALGDGVEPIKDGEMDKYLTRAFDTIRSAAAGAGVEIAG